MKPQLIQHLNGEPIGRFPVWMMRQAGRFLPSYRAIRKDHSFWEMVTTPKLAVEVSLLPLAVLDVDAVIFFSDILTLPFGLGIPISMKESIGPVVENPLRNEKDFSILTEFNPKVHTGFVAEALSEIRRVMPPEKTLIGFAGAPWTVACYLIQGRGKNAFTEVTAWEQRDPEGLARALDKLRVATTAYLQLQVDAGADLVQLFDTWLSQMSLTFFSKHYIPMLNSIFEGLQSKGVKIIYFAKGAGPYLHEFHRLTADALSIDSSLDLNVVDETLHHQFSLQGNFDPEVLLHADEATVRLETRKLVQKSRLLKKPPIINLGHGIFPKTPVENVKAFVDEARTLWI